MSRIHTSTLILVASAPPRLPYLPQPVDTTLHSDPVRSIDISLHKNTSLHHYDQDVVRELSLPPDSINPSAPTRSQHHHSYGFPTRPQPEGTSSSYLTSPISTNVPLETYNSRPRTPSVSLTQPSFFAHHGLPAKLPPPPRTTFYTTDSRIPPQEQTPEADNVASYFDSLLRGSYSQMLSKKSDTAVSSDSAPELPKGGESPYCPAPPATADPYPPPWSFPRLAEMELSLDDMLQADYLDSSNQFDEFLTSPLIQDDSPEETPFLATPCEGEDVWTSPMVDAADDSFGFGEMPLFGAAVAKHRHDDQHAHAKRPPSESLDVFGLLQLFTPDLVPSASPSTKIDAITPVLAPLDVDSMYTIPQTPALAPSSLYTSPRLPSCTLTPASPQSSSSTATVTANTTMLKLSRPTKPLPTGTRRNITPAALVPIDAPTQPRQYITPSATSRKALPTAFTRKGKKRARSEVDHGFGAGAGEHDEQQDDADLDIDLSGLDPNTQEAIEAKRRQNTLAARRSRQRKLAHVRELEETVARVERDRDMWMARAYDAEAKLRTHGLL